MRRSLILFAMLGMAGAALASPLPKGGRPCAGHFRTMMRRMEHRRMEQLTVLVGLTPAQAGKVKAILSEEHAQIRQSMRKVIEEARATHRAVHKQTLAKLSAVLTPQQMRKFKLLMPGRMLIQFHGGPGARVFGPGMP